MALKCLLMDSSNLCVPLLPWCCSLSTLVLQFEHRLRREAFKLVNKGEKTLAEALEAVTKDAELKESYFTTPLALTNHDTARHGGQRTFNNT